MLIFITAAFGKCSRFFTAGPNLDWQSESVPV